MATMLYKKGLSNKIWGVNCDYAVFDDEDVNDAISKGWVKTPLDIESEDNPPKKKRTKKSTATKT